MKKMFLFTLLALFFAVSICSAEMIKSKTNLMKSANIKSKIVKTLTAGTEIAKTGKKQGSWVEVKTNDGNTGWVLARNIKASSTKPAKATTAVKEEMKQETKKIEEPKKMIEEKADEETAPPVESDDEEGDEY